MLQKAYSEIEDLVAGKTLGELIKVREEANPPLTLVPDERGVEEALREKIRRPRGRILPIDYERVGVMRLEGGFIGDNIDFLKDFPNVTKLKAKGGMVKNIKGINALKSLEILNIECNNADLKPLSELKTLKEFVGPVDNLPFVTNNKRIQRLWLRTGRGGIQVKLEKGKSVPVLDFSLLKSFPDLEKFLFDWNSVYQSKDFEVLIKLKKLQEVQILQEIPDSLSDQTLEEIRTLLPNVKVEIIEKF